MARILADLTTEQALINAEEAAFDWLRDNPWSVAMSEREEDLLADMFESEGERWSQLLDEIEAVENEADEELHEEL